MSRILTEPAKNPRIRKGFWSNGWLSGVEPPLGTPQVPVLPLHHSHHLPLKEKLGRQVPPGGVEPPTQA